ncbi:membrane protein implicated in regulation of membrane protease activity [Kineococcus radiotolerans]|uniref:DUF4229 domain-containing protein n=2 Tax=Kineococcus radiotolerans TaxID=131568 RepID=A6W9A9_KINRD|nr:DUF4229 domain-containing protein [Kineococcus radiotolerans]ABS03398.1 hypothetical protein Krad_1912 [Kineococcus radiotolerans SRS30216 = ATCC BAA-149]MBB2899483.1 membrane protein implicated in regulation of membrane protease activity [Kineococcus radiotolerans]
MNPYLSFALLRVGFLVLPLGVLTLLGVEAPLSIAIAVVLSVVLSAVFLRDQRRRISERVTDRAARRTPPRR